MATVWHDNGSAAPLPDEELRQAALGMLLARRAMRGTLPAALIHDVALELLLGVYLDRAQLVSVEQLVADADVAAGVIRRWLLALASEELVVIVEERVALTDRGAERMAAMLTSVVRSQRDLLGWAHH